MGALSYPQANETGNRSETQPGIAGTVRGRLIRGFGATALGSVVTAASCKSSASPYSCISGE